MNNDMYITFSLSKIFKVAVISAAALTPSATVSNGTVVMPETRIIEKPNSASFSLSIDDSNLEQYQTQLDINYQKLNEIAQFKYGEKNNIIISDDYIVFIKNVLKNLGEQQPEVFPTAGGDIQLEYEDYDSGKYLEFVLYRNHYMDFFKIGEDGIETEIDNIPFDIDLITKEVNNYYAYS